MQTVTLDVLDLLPCLIWELLVKSHSNKTQVWKQRGHLGETMLWAALHIFTVNELMLQMLWRRNKGCLRQELPCCVFTPGGEEALCVNNGTWRGDRLFIWCGPIRLDCCGALSTHLGGKDVCHSADGRAPVLLCELGEGFFISFAPCALCICKPQSPLQLSVCCRVNHGSLFASLWPWWICVYLSPFFSDPLCAQLINCVKEELTLRRWVLWPRIKTAVKRAWETEQTNSASKRQNEFDY